MSLKGKVKKIGKELEGFRLKKNLLESSKGPLGNIDHGHVNIRYYNFSIEGPIGDQVDLVAKLEKEGIPHQEFLVQGPLRKLYDGNEDEARVVLESTLKDFGPKYTELASRVKYMEVAR